MRIVSTLLFEGLKLDFEVELGELSHGAFGFEANVSAVEVTRSKIFVGNALRSMW